MVHHKNPTAFFANCGYQPFQTHPFQLIMGYTDPSWKGRKCFSLFVLSKILHDSCRSVWVASRCLDVLHASYANPTYPLITGVITHLLSGMSHQVWFLHSETLILAINLYTPSWPPCVFFGNPSGMRSLKSHVQNCQFHLGTQWCIPVLNELCQMELWDVLDSSISLNLYHQNWVGPA